MSTESKFPPTERSLPVPEEGLREQRMERIAARAFELYEARGGEHGLDLDDWLQAEQQIDNAIEKDDEVEGLERDE
ncbi:MAG: DUF2934 domain-containing protein [Acidobacteria bacterium]|nr:DUF2934 domain-containing protein [Acidobacteriota bacterium]